MSLTASKNGQNNVLQEKKQIDGNFQPNIVFVLKPIIMAEIHPITPWIIMQQNYN